MYVCTEGRVVTYDEWCASRRTDSGDSENNIHARLERYPRPTRVGFLNCKDLACCVRSGPPIGSIRNTVQVMPIVALLGRYPQTKTRNSHEGRRMMN